MPYELKNNFPKNSKGRVPLIRINKFNAQPLIIKDSIKLTNKQFEFYRDNLSLFIQEEKIKVTLLPEGEVVKNTLDVSEPEEDTLPEKELQDMTLNELRALAKELGVKSARTRDKLINGIVQKRESLNKTPEPEEEPKPE